MPIEQNGINHVVNHPTQSGAPAYRKTIRVDIYKTQLQLYLEGTT